MASLVSQSTPAPVGSQFAVNEDVEAQFEGHWDACKIVKSLGNGQYKIQFLGSGTFVSPVAEKKIRKKPIVVGKAVPAKTSVFEEVATGEDHPPTPDAGAVVAPTKNRSRLRPTLAQKMVSHRMPAYKHTLAQSRVCRVHVAAHDGQNEYGNGTGFIINGKALHPALPKLCVVTNHHVVENNKQAQHAKAIFFDEEFNSIHDKFEVDVMHVAVCSPRDTGLDYSILVLSPEAEKKITNCVSSTKKPFRLLQPPQLDCRATPEDFVGKSVLCIGHSEGKSKTVLTMNVVEVDTDPDDGISQITYRSAPGNHTPDDKLLYTNVEGSSGSPVYHNDTLDVIALNHSMDDEEWVHEAPDGICRAYGTLMSSIKEDVQKQLRNCKIATPTTGFDGEKFTGLITDPDSTSLVSLKPGLSLAVKGSTPFKNKGYLTQLHCGMGEDNTHCMGEIMEVLREGRKHPYTGDTITPKDVMAYTFYKCRWSVKGCLKMKDGSRKKVKKKNKIADEGPQVMESEGNAVGWVYLTIKTKPLLCDTT